MKNILFLILFSLPLAILSQITEKQVRLMAKEAPEPQLIIESSSFVQEGQLFYASILVDRLLQFDSLSANYNYRKGYLLLTSKFDYLGAMKHFNLALPTANSDYDLFSITDTTCPIDIYYYLGNCYHLDEQLEKAKELYTKFSNLSESSNALLVQANLNLIQCDVAENLMSTPKKSKINNIGSAINTEYPEYSPVISLDGQALYFTSRRPWEDGSTKQYRDPYLHNYPEDIYISYKDRDPKTNEFFWNPPMKLDFCEGKRNEATIAISPDERRIYVYQDNTGGGDIFYSDFKTTAFQQVQPLDIKNVNTKSWETHCTVTTDGLNIYFVSDRPGGLGGRDIYRIVKLPDGSWSMPKNLGPTINSPFDEDSPFIGADNKTLYYSSNGAESMGGFDIFYSLRDESNNWSLPKNLGYPINRTGDDLFYTTTVDGTKGYFTSFRRDGFGEKDIYEIENDELGIKSVSALRGVIHTAYNKPLPTGISLKVKCTNCDNSDVTEIFPRLRDGSFFDPLVKCKEYEVSYLHDSQEFFSEKFSTDCLSEYTEVYRELLLDVENMKFVQIQDTVGKTYDAFMKMESLSADVKISETETVNVSVGTDLSTLIEINPIYFDLDKAIIRPDAMIELDKIVKIMNQNPTMVIELGSHTDCRASKSYNMKLSDRRAKASAAYIKKRIVESTRIYGKGYGESMLKNGCACEGTVVSTCTEEEHQLNRRTEFVIKKFN